MKNETQLFTDEDYKKLILIACEPGATKEQMLLFIRKCEAMRADAYLLDLLMSRKLKVTGYTECEFILSEPS